MHWGDKLSLFVHFSLFFELKSDILFICMDNICATWSHDFKIYCDWLPSFCSLRLLRDCGVILQAAEVEMVVFREQNDCVWDGVQWRIARKDGVGARNEN